MDEKGYVDLADRKRKQEKEKLSLFKQIKFAVLFTIATLLGLFLTHNVFSFNYIPSESMQNTLCVGDIMLGTYQYDEIERYDIVVFYPSKEKNEKYVKRVIGLPGEKIKMKDDKVYINGEEIEQDFVKEYYQWNMDETIIPDGKYFVLGDNRNNSKDSRYIGCVDAEDILTVQKYIIYPFSRIRKIGS